MNCEFFFRPIPYSLWMDSRDIAENNKPFNRSRDIEWTGTATISVVIYICLSVCLSARLFVRMEQLSSHWSDFNEIGCLSFFEKSVEKFQVLLKSDKNKGYFTWRRMFVYGSISLTYKYS
jgi:hypothetical protein